MVYFSRFCRIFSLMFNQSSQTPYDLRFSLFTIPVQVHPFFWLTAIFLGLGLTRDENGAQAVHGTQVMLCWVIAVFIGVLVHELGHALTIRYLFGGYPRIVLYGLGGAAMHSPHYRRTPRMWGRILISFSGPLFGFILAGICHMLMMGLPLDSQQVDARWFLWHILLFLYVIGIFWGIINLLPVLPMDGGHICQEICRRFSPWRGDVLAVQISLFTAVGVALLGLYFHQTFLAIMFGIMAYMNYQSLSFRRW